MLRLMAIPLPVTIYALVISAAALLLGVALLTWGTPPRWLPSGLVDPEGRQAVLSARVYRMIGAGCGLLGIALGSETIGQSGASVLLAFSLIGIALVCLLVAASEGWSERRARSLRRTRSAARWSAVGFVVVAALNYGLWYYLVFGIRRR